MNGILITPQIIKKEFLILMGCLSAGILLNFIAIIIYEAPISELWTQMPFVLVLSVVIYGFLALIRTIFSAFSHWLSKAKHKD